MPIASTPSIEGRFFQPAEWAPHSAVWLAWPEASHLWEESLGPVQMEFANLCRMIAGPIESGEKLHVCVPHDRAKLDATRALKGVNVEFHTISYGDIWLRDTAPVFLKNESTGAVKPACFQFNGWGGKYILPHDAELSFAIAGNTRLTADFVLEGGSVEVDGEGTCLTTEQCLLNPNRNPGLDKDQIEALLKEWLGVTRVLWIKEGLLNDHTDGHIDTIVRFVAPGTVVTMMPTSGDDPNARVLLQIREELAQMTDAAGRALKVIEIPSPGRILNADGEVMPASFVNFYIGNSCVVVPTYGTKWDDTAVKAIGQCFSRRRTVGLSARKILEGGGAFHCITQQVPN